MARHKLLQQLQNAVMSNATTGECTEQHLENARTDILRFALMFCRCPDALNTVTFQALLPSHSNSRPIKFCTANPITLRPPQALQRPSRHTCLVEQTLAQ